MRIRERGGRVVLGTVLVLVGAACDSPSDRAGSGSAAVRDSAGIRIVEVPGL